MPSTEKKRAVRGAKRASDCSAYSGKRAGAVRRRRLARLRSRFKVLRRRAWRRTRRWARRLFYAMAFRPEKPYAWKRPVSRRQRVRRRNRFIALAAALLLVAVMAWMWRAASVPSAVTVAPTREMPCVEVFFNQQDPAWSDAEMGDSGRTIGMNGDAVACLASLVSMQHIEVSFDGAVDPGTLNAWLSANGCYDGDGALRWQRIAQLLGAKLTRRAARRGDEAIINRLLDNEVYALVEVRRPDTGRMHAVLVVGSVHGEYTIVDPLDGMDALNTMGLYNNEIYTITYLEKKA